MAYPREATDFVLPQVQPGDYDPSITRLGIIGQRGAGKGEVCNYLAELGISVYSSGELVGNEVKQQPADVFASYGIRFQQLTEKTARHRAGLTSMLMRRKYGPDVLIQPLLDATTPTAVDGIRTVWDYSRIRDTGGSLVVIDTPEELRRAWIENDPGRSGNRKPLSTDSHAIEEMLDDGVLVAAPGFSWSEREYFAPRLPHIMELAQRDGSIVIRNDEPGLENLHRKTNAALQHILGQATSQIIDRPQ